MAFLEDQLEIKISGIEGSGKGLFTTKKIVRGTTILEYTGNITTWKAMRDAGDNNYLFYVNQNRVIDASNDMNILGRYVNDAKGLVQVAGLKNNARYVNEKGRIYLQAIYTIPAGAEIFAHYGKSYWDTVRSNLKLEKQKQ